MANSSRRRYITSSNAATDSPAYIQITDKSAWKNKIAVALDHIREERDKDVEKLYEAALVKYQNGSFFRRLFGIPPRTDIPSKKVLISKYINSWELSAVKVGYSFSIEKLERLINVLDADSAGVIFLTDAQITLINKWTIF